MDSRHRRSRHRRHIDIVVELIDPLRDLIKEISGVFQLVAVHEAVLELLKFVEDDLAALYVGRLRFLLDQLIQSFDQGWR